MDNLDKVLGAWALVTYDRGEFALDLDGNPE